jgi:glycosyltransferase involved in cell wall biosynthesis
MPFFSVIIPLYNKEKYIEATINSVLNQTFKDFEIIIVDDGSTDNSYKIVSRFQDLQIFKIQQENQGVSIARNFGIENSNSEYIALLDADDIWEPNHLNELHKSIIKHPKASLFCNAYNLKLTNKFTHKGIYNIHEKNEICIIDDYFESSSIHPIAWTSAVAFKKQDFNDIGTFNPNLFSGQDIDLWIRFALNKTIVFNPTITTCYNRIVKNSLSKSIYRKSKYLLFNFYTNEEKTNASLRKYLNLNRYSLAIQCKYHNEIDLYKKLKKEIDYKNLNFKQRMLLKFPKFLLKFIKRFQLFLINKNIYLTTYS